MITELETAPLNIFQWEYVGMRLPQWLSDKESVCNAGDLGLIPRSGRSPGGKHGNPL